MSQCGKKDKSGEPCGKPATIGMVDCSGKKIARCDEHGVTKNPPRSIGKVCPFCDRGFVRQWAHRDNGLCYRCNGKGHW